MTRSSSTSLFTPVELRFGIIFAVLSCAWVTMEALVLRFTQDPTTSEITSALAPLLPILVLWFAIGARRQELGDRLTWLQGFVSGLKVSLLGGLAMGIFTILYYLVLDTGLIAQAIELSPETFPEDLRDSPQHIALLMASFSVVFTLLFGAVISTVVSWIRRQI